MLSAEDPKEIILKAELLRAKARMEDAYSLLKILKLTESDYDFPRVQKIHELAVGGFVDVAIYQGHIRKPEPAWWAKKIAEAEA